MGKTESLPVRSLAKILAPLLFTVAATAAPPVVEVSMPPARFPQPFRMWRRDRGRLQVYRHRNRTSQEVGANVPLPTTAGLAGLTLQVNVGSAQAYPCILFTPPSRKWRHTPVQRALGAATHSLLHEHERHGHAGPTRRFA